MSNNDSENSESVLPENCRYVRVGRKNIRVTVKGDEDWLDEPDFEDVEIDESWGSAKTKGQVRFEAGEHIPLEVAETVYSAFKDRLVLEDGNYKQISRGKNVTIDTSETVH